MMLCTFPDATRAVEQEKLKHRFSNYTGVSILALGYVHRPMMKNEQNLPISAHINNTKAIWEIILEIRVFEVIIPR